MAQHAGASSSSQCADGHWYVSRRHPDSRPVAEVVSNQLNQPSALGALWDTCLHVGGRLCCNVHNRLLPETIQGHTVRWDLCAVAKGRAC